MVNANPKKIVEIWEPPRWDGNPTQATNLKIKAAGIAKATPSANWMEKLTQIVFGMAAAIDGIEKIVYHGPTLAQAQHQIMSLPMYAI